MGSKDKKRIGFTYAIHGIKYVFVHERNFRFHVLSFIAVIMAAIIFRLSTIEWIIVLVVSTTVLAAEVVNSAIERMIDYMKPDIHPTAKVIKDMAAGAVLIIAIGAFVTGCIIFLPKVMEFF